MKMNYFVRATSVIVTLTLVSVSRPVSAVAVITDTTAGKYVTSSGPNDKRRVSLPSGFEGKILKAYEYSPRYYALEVEGVGKSSGQNVWVPQASNVSGIRLFADSKSRDANRFEFITPKEAQYLKTEKVITAYDAKIAPVEKTPTKIPLIQIPAVTQATENEKKIVSLIDTTNAALMGNENSCYAKNMMNEAEKVAFALRETSTSPPAPVVKTEATLIPVTTDQNPLNNADSICGEIDQNRFEVCKEKSSVAKYFTEDFRTKFKEADTVMKYKLSNKGPNNVIDTPSEGKTRDWAFFTEGKARQDLGFSITDYTGGNVSESQSTHIMVFPRKYLPHVKEVGDHQIVTLPTGETVIFDAKTKSVIGGALTEEGPMTAGTKKSAAPKVKYSGSGVMVRVDGKTLEPRQQKNAKVTITKGNQTCKVPLTELWPNQSESGAPHFKYPTDEGFNKYLQSKCGFGL